MIDIRKAKVQLEPYATSSNADIAKTAKSISADLSTVEDAIYQTKLRAGEDALNFPIKLNNKLAAVLSTVMDTDTSPTAQSYEVFKELNTQLQVQLDKLEQIEHHDIDGFNTLVKEKNVPAIVLSSSKK